MFKKKKQLLKDVEYFKSRLSTLDMQMEQLIRILGLCGYRYGVISDTNYLITTEGYIRADFDKQPVKRGDLDLLLNYLGLVIEPQKNVAAKIIPRKIKTGENIKIKAD